MATRGDLQAEKYAKAHMKNAYMNSVKNGDQAAHKQRLHAYSGDSQMYLSITTIRASRHDTLIIPIV